MRTLISTAILIAAFAVFAGAQTCDALDANLGFARNDIRRALDNTSNVVSDDIQLLLFEPDAWKAKFAASIKCSASAFPANWQSRFTDVLTELRGIVDNDMKNKQWKPRAFSRPVEEKMAATQFTNYYKGIQILKNGSNYRDWQVYKNSLGIPTNRYIRGEIVAKLPNRPGCQAMEWVIKQQYAGGSYGASKMDAFGGGGYFVACP